MTPPHQGQKTRNRIDLFRRPGHAGSQGPLACTRARIAPPGDAPSVPPAYPSRVRQHVPGDLLDLGVPGRQPMAQSVDPDVTTVAPASLVYAPSTGWPVADPFDRLGITRAEDA